MLDIYYFGDSYPSLSFQTEYTIHKVKKELKFDIPFSFNKVNTLENAIDIGTYLNIIRETNVSNDVLIIDDMDPSLISLDQANVMWCDGDITTGMYIKDRFNINIELGESLYHTFKDKLKVIPSKSSGRTKTTFSMNLFRKISRLSPIKLCLCMIVKNESKIIRRCFDSIVDYLDYWIICDTGSTDGTPELIKDYFKEKNIDGKLFKVPWYDFGKNRTMLIQEAVKTLNRKNYYLLLLDADFEMRINDKNFKKTLDLNYEGFKIQYEGNNEYYRPILVSADYPWYFKHKTHEYLTCYEPHNQTKSSCMTIIEHPDGGAKSDKFERDIKMLTSEINESIEKGEKPEARSFFYLAQSYECIGKINEAIETYEGYANQINKWDEEEYITLYRIANLRFNRGDPIESVAGYYVKAYLKRPTRLEALSSLTRHYQWRERYQEAYNYGMMYKKYYKSYPSDILFIDRFKHMFEFWDALAISSYYVGDYQHSLECTKKIIEYGNYGNQFTRVMNNAGFSIDKTIPETISKAPVRIDDILGYQTTFKRYYPSKIMEKFNPSSPSIVSNGDGYLMNIRCVNYTINEQQGWRYKYEGNIRTENIICDLDEDLNIIRERVITLGDTKLPYSCGIEGLEDIRLFWNKGQLNFTATCLQVKANGAKCMVMGRLNLVDDQALVSNLQTLDGYGGSFPQKNWTFIEGLNDVKFVYSFAPLVTLKYNGTNVGLDKVSISVSNKWRGSSQAIPYKEGWLTLVHTSNFPKYSHTFVYFDETKIIKWSDPFYFEKYEIEFVCGMCWSNDKTNAIICYSRLDGSSNVMTISSSKLQELL